MLAKTGLTGPLTIFEGKYGMVRMLARKDDPTPLIEGFGEDFGILHVEFKYHPVNISIQSPINLLTELVQFHDLKPADIERIDVGCRAEHSKTHVGAIYEPQDVLGAQFSMPFSLAIRIAKSLVTKSKYYDVAYQLAQLASEPQKQALLPRIATGEYSVAFGLTEPDAGTGRDLKSRAVRDGLLLSIGSLLVALALLAAGVATGRRREPRAAAPGAAKPIAPAGAGA